MLSRATARRGPERVREVSGRAGRHPVLRLEAWETRHPGLVAGITALHDPARVGGGAGGPDFAPTRVRGGVRMGPVHAELAGALGLRGVAAAAQVHGARVLRVSRETPEAGTLEEGDGLLCGEEGVLLLVHVADCVPVYLLDPESGAVGLLHAGWRGVAAGILPAALRELNGLFGTQVGRVYLHLGPAICGSCYEVGGEVSRSLGRSEVRGFVDLRGELARQAAESGMEPGRITVSTLCTRCGPEPLFSFRRDGEAAGRHAAFLGWRPA